MEEFYIVGVTKSDYERLTKLIEVDEKNRVKGREKMRNKSGNTNSSRSLIGPTKKKIQMRLLGFSPKEPEPQISQFNIDQYNNKTESTNCNNLPTETIVEIQNMKIMLQKMEHDLITKQSVLQ